MKIIEVIAEADYLETITRIAGEKGAKDCWHGTGSHDERLTVRLLVGDEQRQDVLDALQSALGASESTLILVSPIEAVLPREEEEDEPEDKKRPGRPPPGKSFTTVSKKTPASPPLICSWSFFPRWSLPSAF